MEALRSNSNVWGWRTSAPSESLTHDSTEKQHFEHNGLLTQ